MLTEMEAKWNSFFVLPSLTLNEYAESVIGHIRSRLLMV